MPARFRVPEFRNSPEGEADGGQAPGSLHHVMGRGIDGIKGIKPQGKPWTRFFIGNPAASGWGIKNPDKGGRAVKSLLDAI